MDISIASDCPTVFGVSLDFRQERVQLPVETKQEAIRTPVPIGLIRHPAARHPSEHP
jgi:hypothetical protein